MSHGYIKIVYYAENKLAKIEGQNCAIGHTELRKFLKEHNHIYSLVIKNPGVVWYLDRIFPKKYNITVEKLTLYSNSFISKKINHFGGQVKVLRMYSDIELRYVEKLRSRFPNLVIRAPCSDDLKKTYIKLPVLFDGNKLDKACSKLDPEVKSLRVNLLSEYSTGDIITVLSNSFEKICINGLCGIHITRPFLQDGRVNPEMIFEHLDKQKIIEAIISSPAVYICLQNMSLANDDIIDILNKPGIISLTIKDDRCEHIGEELFDDNYTIQKFCLKNSRGTQVLPRHIYLRNTSDSVRFKRTKVAH